MKDCYRFALRSAWLVLVFSIWALGLAQDTVVPKWNTVGNVGSSVSYSNDGNSLLFGGGGFSVWSVPKGQLLLHESVSCLTTTFNADGTKIFYASDNGSLDVMYEYDIATRTRVKLPGLSPTVIRRQPVVSRDGKWLALIVNYQDDVIIYDLQAKSVRSTLHRPGTTSIDFINNDSRFIVNGPGVYDLDGNLLYGSASTNSTFIFATPNKSMVLSQSGGVLKCYRVSDLQLLWSTTNTPEVQAVSRDSANLFFMAGAGAVGVINIADGARRSSTITYPAVTNENYYVAASPTSDTVLITTNSSSSEVMRCTYEPATGSGGYVNTLMSGMSHMGYLPATWKVGANFVPSVMGYEGVGNYNDPTRDLLFTVRRAATGEVLFQKMLGSKWFSPDRQHYIGTDISIDPYRIYDSATATPIFETHAQLLEWHGPNTVSAYFDKTGDMGVFRWNGSTFIHDRKDIPKGTFGESRLYNYNYAFSPDGNRFVGVNSSQEVKIYDLVHGSVIGTFTPQSSTSYWYRLRFSDQNLLSINEVDPATGENVLRIYTLPDNLPSS